MNEPVERSNAEILRSVFTSLPHARNFHAGDALASSAIGAGIAGLIGAVATREKKNRLRNILISALGGGLAGLGYYTVKQNALEQTGGLYTEDPAKLPDVSKNKPGETYTVYMRGMGDRPVTSKDFGQSKNTVTFPYAESGMAARFIDSLHPEDKVVVVGHSMGGQGAFRAVNKTHRQIQRMYTLDPVSYNVIDHIRMKIGKRPDNVDKWVNYWVSNYKPGIPANDYIKGVPSVGLIGKTKGAENIDDAGGDHGMHDTGLRSRNYPVMDASNTHQTVLDILSGKKKDAHA